jgi:signal transduction histidine kinase
MFVAAIQWLSLKPQEDPRLIRLTQWRMMSSVASVPPAELANAPLVTMPMRRLSDGDGVIWLEADLPQAKHEGEVWALSLEYRPHLRVYLNGALLANDDPEADGDLRRRQLLVGMRHMQLVLPSSLFKTGPQRLQLRLAAPLTQRQALNPALLGPRDVVLEQDSARQMWQTLRGFTAGGAVLAAMFLGLVAWVRREEPLYALSAAHVALLALLLTPYVLNQQPLPTPWWRMLLDAADLVAKALQVAVVAHWAGVWTEGLRRFLLGLLALGLPIDLWAAFHNLSWGDFSHPWPWWALGSRAALLLLALALALHCLAKRPSVAQWGNALLVGLSAFTWAWVSLASLALRAPMVDSNTLAHAGWVLWVVLMLQRHFVQSARRDKRLRQELATELSNRTVALEDAYAAKTQAQREQAAGEQRQRLLQDLHDGLGARLLTVRLQAAELSPNQLAQAIDECLLEMRLSVDTLTEDQGDLGVLLGSWRHRVSGMLRSAGLEIEWRVMDAPSLPCLRGSGALELVRFLQEALANTVRHAKARNVILGTQRTTTHVILWWVDDGRGVNPSAPEGMGRRSMASRAQRLGGRLDVISPAPREWLEAGTGTALALHLPLPAAD